MTALSVHPIAGGTLGALQTLQRMRVVVNRALFDPLVIEEARRLVRDTPSRDTDAHALAIRQFLQDHFQFVADPRGVEYLATPRYLLTGVAEQYVTQGDCDDAAILGAALGKAVGLRARFVALGFFSPRAPLSHVFTVLKGRSRWIDLDTTRAARRLVEAPISRVTELEV